MDKGTILNELGEDPHNKLFFQLNSKNQGILSAWVEKDMKDPAEEPTTSEKETDSKEKTLSRVLIKKNDTESKDLKEEQELLEASLGREDTLDPMLDNEVPLLTKPQFVALLIFKLFIQAPIEAADALAKTTPILTRSAVKFSIDSANSIRDFIELIYFLCDPDSALEDFYSVKKGT
jgi:hypothetical protein